MLSEQWLPVRGYEGFYEVSNLGRVRSLDRVVMRGNGVKQTVRPRILRQAWAGDPGKQRLTVHLTIEGNHKTHKVHRLVAEHFCPGQEPGLEVCHNDSDPENNVAENLRWDTSSSNRLDMYAAGRR